MDMNMFSGREGMVWWQGVIEDVKDPEALGRVKVRIIGWHTADKALLPTEKLPWATPLMPITSSSTGGIGQSPTGALPGAWVMGFFRDGEHGQDPIIFGTIYGRPTEGSETNADGTYPSESGSVFGGSTKDESDVNRLARGVKDSTSNTNGGDENTSSSGNATECGKEVNQDGVPSDKENRKRLSKITTKSGKTAWVATVFKDQFQGFVNELEGTGYVIKSIGGYAYRKNVNNPSRFSYHASGAAIDINPAENPNGNTLITDMPDGVSSIARKYGLGWGGDWNSVKDAMHFSAASGERGSTPLKRNGIVPDPASGSQTESTSGGGTDKPGESQECDTVTTSESGATSSRSADTAAEQQSQAPSASATQWSAGRSYNEGDLVKSPPLEEGEESSGPPYTMRSGTLAAAEALGISAIDLATVMSYETGGTLDPQKRGPTTKWGQHRGLIQFGEPQANQYGVDFSTPQTAIDTQLGPSGAVVKYLRDKGVRPGMGRLEVYSAINAGGIGEKYYSRSDTAAGGAAGTVRDKVNNQMEGHERNAKRLLAGSNDSTFVQQKTFIAKNSGTSDAEGDGPTSSSLKDGDILWEVYEDPLPVIDDAVEEGSVVDVDQSPSTFNANSGNSSYGQDTYNPRSIVEMKKESTESTELFDEPPTPYAAEYPHNKVISTESGHHQEFDDTPGAERIHTYHRSGTFEEIHPDGSVVTKVVKDNYEIIFGNNNIYVKGTINVVVDADVNIRVGGNVDAKVGGTIDTESGGNTTIKAPNIHLNP